MNKIEKLGFIWMIVIYLLFIGIFQLFGLDMNTGKFYFVTAWIVIYFVGFVIAKSFKDENKELDFELKFYGTITIGILAGIIASLYTASEIKNVEVEIFILVIMILLYGGFLVIEIIKPNFINRIKFLSDNNPILKDKLKEESKGNNKINWVKVNAIASTILAFIAILALIASVLTSINSVSLSKRVIEMTPSKYAYIESTLSQWLYDTAYYRLSDILSSKKLSKSNQLGFNIINTGQLNTGELQVFQRYNDNTIHFTPIIVGDLASKSNNALWLNFSITNYSNTLGLHQVNLTISCPNCLEQGVLIPKSLKVCIYNDTDNLDDIAKRDCIYS